MKQVADPLELVRHARKKAYASKNSGRESAHKTVIEQVETPSETWLQLTEITLDALALRRNNIIVDQNDPQAVHIDRLRTRCLRVMRSSGLRRLAITSPDLGCGKSTVAANLALSMARQHDLRVMLFDFDLRKPSLIHHFDLAEVGPRFSALLHTRRNFDVTTLRVGKNLALSLNATPADYPAEMLASKRARDLLNSVQQDFDPDVMLFDLPPLLNVDDTLAALDCVDAALLVARADYSTIDQIDQAERLITEQTTCLGVVLNQSRFD